VSVRWGLDTGWLAHHRHLLYVTSGPEDPRGERAHKTEWAALFVMHCCRQQYSTAFARILHIGNGGYSSAVLSPPNLEAAWLQPRLSRMLLGETSEGQDGTSDANALAQWPHTPARKYWPQFIDGARICTQEVWLQSEHSPARTSATLSNLPTMV
jgi:hypothetical protein